MMIRMGSYHIFVESFVQGTDNNNYNDETTIVK